MCGGVDADLRVEACAALPVATMCAPFSVRVMSNFTSAAFAASTSFANSSSSQSTSASAFVRHGVDNSTGLEGNDLLADLAGYGKAEQTFFAVAYAVSRSSGVKPMVGICSLEK